ncbi:MAG: SDR family NAD(P)-dependent oxidoreductase [Chloroflexi bacterium]|nr:SDR family NAD(P)-dependent oxidoreductase [Chloroflexota bacterium]
MPLTDKVILVTGGGQGQGSAIVAELARQGAKLGVHDHELSAAEEVVRQLPPKRAIALSGNLAVREDVQRMVDAIVEQFGRIDGLVTCALPINEAPSLPEITQEAWNEVAVTGLRGMFLTTQIVGQRLIEQRSGGIVYVAPTAEGWEHDWSANYAAARSAIVGFCRTIGKEFSRNDVRVNALMPPAKRVAVADLWSVYASRVPMGAMAEPADVAPIVAFLLSDESKYLTGQVIGLEWY